MFSTHPIEIELPAEDAALDCVIEGLPRIPVVFALDVGEGQHPYLSRTSNLWRRMRRLLRPAEGTSRMLNLRGIARALSYWRSPNALDASLTLWEQARRFHPDRYRRMLRLRHPYYAALLVEDRFPRGVITRNPARDDTAFGPFPTRGDAEAFLSQTLDLFLLRRCEEDLQPQPDHPGCIYGEMAMCLRPCQAATDDATYRAEAREFLALLATRGESLQQRLEQERAAASEELDFESAARLHKRLAKLNSCFPPSLGFARMLSLLHGVAVAPGRSPEEAMLWPLWGGHLQPPRAVSASILEAAVLQGLVDSSRANAVVHPAESRQELLALFAKWLRSSWCDGVWIEMADDARVPTRRLRNAIRRVTGHIHPPAAEKPREESEAGDEARHV